MAISKETFNNYLQQILSARYGEEVRGSIHDSLQGMYEIVQQNVLDVSTAKNMLDTVDSLNQIKTEATNAANAANQAASNLNQLKTEASNAASSANAAASAANTASSNATEAFKKASEAVAAANNAVLAAQSATSDANAAASRTNTAISKANEAANSIEEAKTAAEDAASKANTAASNADTATSKANTAASNADKQTEKATEATTNATQAANRANSAAQIVEDLQIGDLVIESIATKDYVGEQIDAIEIGGRNLALNTNNPIRSGEVSQPTSWPGYYSYVTDKETLRSLFGKTITISFDYDVRLDSGNFDFSINNVYQTVQRFDQDFQGHGHIAKTINVNTYSGELHDTSITYIQLNSFVGNFVISNLKIERGNKPTDWSPAPEDVDTKIDGIKIGGRNILLTSGAYVSNSKFNICDYYLAQKPAEGEIYTFSIKGSFGSNTYGIGIYNSGGLVNLLQGGVSYIALPENHKGIFSVTFEWKNSQGENTVSDPMFVSVYAYGNESSSDTNTIEWVQLERGNKATDWTPAPEDLIIEVGGRNLFGFNKEISFETYCANVESPDFQMNMAPAVHGYTFKTGSDIVGDGRNMYFRAKNLGFNSIQGWYTFSADISATKDCSIYMGICDILGPDMAISQTPKHYSYSAYVSNYNEPNNTSGFVDLRASMGGSMIPADTTITLANVKIERGNVPTDWSPAPEDMQPAIFDSGGNVKLSGENLQKLATALKTYLN